MMYWPHCLRHLVGTFEKYSERSRLADAGASYLCEAFRMSNSVTGVEAAAVVLGAYGLYNADI
jgi:hypothetical protein